MSTILQQPSSTTPPQNNNTTENEPFKMTPDQLLELQLSRLKAAKVSQQPFTEAQLADYKGENYDPDHERAVLSTGFAGVAAVVVGVTSLMGWGMSNRYFTEADGTTMKKGFFYRMGKFFRPDKMVQELENKRLATEFEVQQLQLDREAKKLGVDLTKVTHPAPGEGMVNNNSPGAPGKVLVQELPARPTPKSTTLTQSQTTTPPTATTAAITAPTSSYGKFQRKGAHEKIIDPSLKAAYDYKQNKMAKQPKKRARKYTSMAAIPSALKSAARSRAGIAFVISTVGLSFGAYGVTKVVCNYFGLHNYTQYTNWMQNEDSGYTPQAIATLSRGLSSGLQQWLLKSPARSLMDMMSAELNKEQEVTMADLQMLDQASVASAYFVGYELDLYSKLLGRPSRACNPSYDEFIDAFKQPVPLSQEEYQMEQLRILRQLSGLSSSLPDSSKNQV